MRRVIIRFLQNLEVEKNASPTTIKAYQHDLKKFHEYLVQHMGDRFLPGDVSRDHIRNYLVWLARVGHRAPNGPSARTRKLGAIRSFFRYSHHEGLVRDNPADDISIPKNNSGEMRSLSEDECKRVLQAVESNPSPFRRIRDRALLETFLLTGARLGELVRLDIGDIDLRQGTIRLLRKGGEIHMLPLADSAKEALKGYLKRRRRRTKTRALFISCSNRRIAPTTIWRLVKSYFRKARIKADGMGPHALRHTFATLLLNKGKNLRVIQVLMSHKSLATTARYLHTRSEELVSAVNSLQLREDPIAAKEAARPDNIAISP